MSMVNPMFSSTPSFNKYGGWVFCMLAEITWPGLTTQFIFGSDWNNELSITKVKRLSLTNCVIDSDQVAVV